MVEADVFKIVTSHVCEVLPELNGHAFSYDERLADLGANSVDRAEIVTKSLETLSLAIPRVELFGVKNIGELTKLLHSKMPS